MISLATLRTHAQTLLLMGALTVAGVAMRSCQDARARAEDSGEQYAKLTVLNDSTTAQLAAKRLELSKYAGLRAAEDSIHGKLLAAVRIKVAPRDTVIIHDTLPTTLAPDSSRTARFRDSTFAGVIDATVTAPPCCQPLRLDSLRIHRPAFTPSVGFVSTGSRTVAVVVWQGERAEVDAPFSKIPAPAKRVTPYVEAWVDPLSTWTVESGVDVRAFWGLSAIAKLEQHLTTRDALRAGVGFRKTF